MEITALPKFEHAPYGLVLGCPRSGTTFLMRMLDTIYELECVSGNLLPVYVPHLVNVGVPPEIYETMAVGFERSLDAYLHSGMYDARSAAVRKWIVADAGIGALFQSLQHKRPIKRFIFKEPFLSFAPAFAYEAVPDSKILYVHRDGRDCADSLVRSYDVLSDERLTHLRSAEMPVGRKVDHRYVPWWVEQGDEQAFLMASPYGRSIWMWREMVRRCDAFIARPEVQASGRVLTVCYEELMRNPVPVFQSVVDHFGVEMSRKLKHQLETAHTRSIGVYKRRPAAEIAEAEAIAEKELRHYGYLR